MNSKRVKEIKGAARKLRYLLACKEYKTKENRDGYMEVTWCSKTLRKLIEVSGLWEFHITNESRSTLLEHQLVKYAHVGYKAFINGFVCAKGVTELHHVNSVRNDNSPENLRYCSPEENKILSQATRTEYLGFPEECNAALFNDRGEAVENSKHHFANLVKLTMEATRGIKVTVVECLMQLPYDLYKKLTRWGQGIWLDQIMCSIL